MDCMPHLSGQNGAQSGLEGCGVTATSEGGRSAVIFGWTNDVAPLGRAEWLRNGLEHESAGCPLLIDRRERRERERNVY